MAKRNITRQNKLLFAAVPILQRIPGGGDFIDNIRQDVYSMLDLTYEDLTEKTGKGLSRLDQRMNNIVSNKLADELKLFIRTGTKGYFQLTTLGINIDINDLYKLIFNKKRKPNRKIKKYPKLPFDQNTIISEGEKSTRTVTHKKRSVVLREQAKRDNKKRDPDGLSRCRICDTVTECDITINGIVIHVDTIIVHHINRISEMDDKGNNTKYSDAVKRTACLCPTCHDTLHKISPEPHPDDLRKALGY